MAHVIIDTCTKDALCVDACPTDCIHPKQDEAKFADVPQMYINQDECIDCGACVPACPTNANLEFRDADARLVSTDELSCIGCGACVEVCPANKLNGGQTLRVVEAPTAAALDAIAEFERMGAR